jgi:protein-tyrosine-phosphatase
MKNRNKTNGKLNILFVCRFNRFRSKVAEAYFNKINKNKKIKAKSAGFFMHPNLNKNQVKIAKEFGIDLKGAPKNMTISLLKWQDLTVIAADNIPISLFDFNKKYGKKTIKWNIKDVKSGDDIQDNKRAIRDIIKKVDELNKRLNKK